MKRIQSAWWFVVLAAAVGAGIGFLLPTKESRASGSRVYGLGAAMDASDPDTTPYLRLEADVVSGEAVDQQGHSHRRHALREVRSRPRPRWPTAPVTWRAGPA